MRFQSGAGCVLKCHLGTSGFLQKNVKLYSLQRCNFITNIIMLSHTKPCVKYEIKQLLCGYQHNTLCSYYFHHFMDRIVFHETCTLTHDDVIKWKHFPRYWPFVRGIHRSPVNSPHKGQCRGALMFTLICARING